MINTVTAFIDGVRQGNAKKVIAITSGMGDTSFVNEIELDVAPSYAISKAGVNMAISKYSAIYKSEGILFLGICPGSVDTDAQNANKRKSYCFMQYNIAETHVNSRIVTKEDVDRIQTLGAKFAAYAPHFKGPAQVDVASRRILEMVANATLEDGTAGTAIPHTGTYKWM